MNAYALHEVSDRAIVRRWGLSAFAILAAHAVLIAMTMNWATSRPAPGVSQPAIMVDLAPLSSAPETMPADMTPGPLQQEADASPPEPARQEPMEEQIAPTPPQQNPEVVAPPEQKLQPPDKPEPAQVVPDRRPAPEAPKAVRPDAKKPVNAPPAPRTTAPPRAENRAPPASAISAGATASAMAAYNQRVRSHLMRFHSNPSANYSGPRRSVPVAFTINRSGGVVSSRVTGSTGVPAFDAHAAAIVRRAQPFPPIPADVPHATMSFTIPLNFDPAR